MQMEQEARLRTNHGVAQRGRTKFFFRMGKSRSGGIFKASDRKADTVRPGESVSNTKKREKATADPDLRESDKLKDLFHKLREQKKNPSVPKHASSKEKSKKAPKRAKETEASADKTRLKAGEDMMGDAREQRRRTEEGWKIYTEEELKIGQGGGTPECPFDCDCCF